MSYAKGKWHMIVVDPEDGVTVTHPHTCSWSIEHHPRQVDTDGHVVNEEHFTQRYTCDVAWELEEGCGETFPTDEGFYWFHLEHVVTPSSPAGPREYDTYSQWTVVKRPELVVERMEVTS